MTQQFRRIEHALQCMRHAMRAHVADHELAFEAEFAGKGCVARARRIAIEVDAVDDDMNLLAVDAARDQVFAEGFGDRNDRAGTSIHEEFEALQQTDERAVSHGADRNDRCRPEVTKFEDPG